jgi:hypothetical protein
LQTVAECLCAIMFLEDTSPRQVFNEFLLARQVFWECWLKIILSWMNFLQSMRYKSGHIFILGIIARTFSSQSTRCGHFFSVYTWVWFCP